MRFKASPESLVVEEIIRLPPGEHGAYAVYRLHKRGITTLQAQARLAAALGVPLAAVAFPALKDKAAATTQYGTVRGGGPAQVDGPGFHAERIGRSSRPLAPRDLVGNRFTLLLQNLSERQAAAIAARLAGLEGVGFPNYFDQQRFGSYAPGQDWVGKRILRRDAEGALRAHLAQAFVGDPPPVRAFKAEAQQHWGEWRYLLEVAPRPSNLRSVLTFLADHPQQYRQALNLVTPRVLSLYLAAYASLLWNRLAAGYLTARLDEGGAGAAGVIEVAGERLPLYDELTTPLLAHLRTVQVPLFHHRMSVSDARMAELVQTTLAAEGMEAGDLKARLLRKAYLPRGKRALLVFPQAVEATWAAPAHLAKGRDTMTISFILPPGSYATLLVRVLAVSSKQ